MAPQPGQGQVHLQPAVLQIQAAQPRMDGRQLPAQFPGEHRCPSMMEDQGEHHLQLAGFQDDVGQHLVFLEPFQQLVMDQIILVVDDEGFLPQAGIPHRSRRSSLEQGIVLGEQQSVEILVEPDLVVERPVPGQEYTEIQQGLFQHPFHLLGGRIEQDHFDEGIFFLEASQHRRKRRHRRNGRQPHVQFAEDFPTVLLGKSFQLPKAGQHLIGLLEEPFPEFGQGNGLVAAPEQLVPQFCFQFLDGAAQRRLGHMDFPGSPAEAPETGDLHKIFQMANVHDLSLFSASIAVPDWGAVPRQQISRYRLV